MAPVVVGLVGSSGAGKTALAERLIPLLSDRGLVVGFVKHAHDGFDLDRRGSDSWRAGRAGAALIGVAGGGRFMLAASHDRAMDHTLDSMLGCDLVLIEGMTTAPWPKVVVESPGVPDRRVPEPVLARIVREPAGVFDTHEVNGLARNLQQLVTPPDATEVVLFADGAPVPLRDFPANLLARAVLAMTSALKGVEQPQDLVLRIRSRRTGEHHEPSTTPDTGGKEEP